MPAIIPSIPLGASFTVGPDNTNPESEEAFEAGVASFKQLMGVAPQFCNAYIDYNVPENQWVANAGWQATSEASSAVARSMTPVIALPLASVDGQSGTPDQQFRAFSSGQYDSVIEGIVGAWVKEGFTNLIFRPGWEMNLLGCPTYVGDDQQSQADWVAAFQHVYTTIHAAAAALGATAQVIWNPGVTNYTNAPATQALYPGDNYVDAIGADVYSNIFPYSDSNTTTEFHDWHTGDELSATSAFIADPVDRVHYWNFPAATEWNNDSSEGHSQSLDSLINFAEQHGKPFAIPETGAGNSDSGTDVSDDPEFPAWLASKLATAQASGERISYVSIWDANDGGNYEFSFLSDNKLLEAQAWDKYFGAQTQVDTSPPLLTVAESLSGATRLTADTISGTVTDSGSGVATVEIYDTLKGSRIDLGAATVVANGGWSFTASNLANGSHSFAAVATDNSGNQTSALSAGAPVLVDTAPPLLTVAESLSGATRLTADTISGTVTDSGSGVATVEIYDTLKGSRIDLGAATVAANGGWSFTASNLANGSHSFAAVATDNSGNQTSALSAGAPVLVDTAPPLLTVAESLSGATRLTADTISGTVTDSGSGVATVEIYDTLKGSRIDLGAATVAANGGWSFTASNLANGSHSFAAVATDNSGNQTSALSAGAPVLVDTIAPQPTIQIIIGNTDGGVTLAGLSKANSTVAVVDDVGGRPVSLGTVMTSSTGAWKLTSHLLISKSIVNEFSASAVDSVGNAGVMPGNLYLTSSGADILVGSAGVSDVFAIMSSKGTDVISGFETSASAGSAHDYIDLSGRGITSFSQVQAMLSGTSSAMLSIGSGETITLTGVAASSLIAADFRFS